ncbi:MAG TPA: hypothetical protein VGM80_16825 [Gaiellaceae bacterium]|jgi:hypothetical protein
MRDLPPPLPPAERTIGQLIGESIRAYGDNFWRIAPLGVVYAAVDQACVRRHIAAQLLIYLLAGPFITAAYVWVCAVVLRVKPTWTAMGVGMTIYLLFPPLRALLILPAVAWFALVGLAVPAVLVEHRDFRSAFARGRELGLADYAHALGSLAALVVVIGVAENTLTAVLHSQGSSSHRAALFLADLILSPMLYLGGAMLYVDQAARVGSLRPDRRSRNAHLHPPLDVDPAGRADAEGKP